MILESERHQASDAVRKELAAVRNESETLLYTTEGALEGYQDVVDPETIQAARESCARLRLLIEQNQDVAQVRAGYQELEAVAFALAEKLYGAT